MKLLNNTRFIYDNAIFSSFDFFFLLILNTWSLQSGARVIQF